MLSTDQYECYPFSQHTKNDPAVVLRKMLPPDNEIMQSPNRILNVNRKMKSVILFDPLSTHSTQI